jgi:CRISPR-associated endonuclease/helicase Cas3
VYRALKQYFRGNAEDGQPELGLLHAQFLYEERENREKRTLLRFGKPRSEITLGDGQTRQVQRPHRAVLVATQVIEQSLDLDFDLMVTDMAPADLILQRAGRLHRHDRQRPMTLEQPRLWICRPKPNGEVPVFESGTTAVYDRYVLLRSWLALKDRQVVRVPEDVEEVIEAVYDDRPCPQGLREALRNEWEETRRNHQKEAEAEREEAKDRWLKGPAYQGPLWRLTYDARDEDAPDFHKAHQALTRLAEPSVPVVFLYGTPKHPFLDAACKEQLDLRLTPTVPLARRLLFRSVNISDKRVVHQLLKRDVPPSWRKSPLLRNHRLLLLNESGVVEVDPYKITLDSEAGVIIGKFGMIEVVYA